jgi:ribosome-associated protein
VNTSDTRVELLFDPGTSVAFTEPQLRRILKALPAGPISVTASEHRSQLRNRGAARERLVAILREAVAPPPPPRRPTKPSKASQRRRVEAKKQRGRTKDLRGRVTDE